MRECPQQMGIVQCPTSCKTNRETRTDRKPAISRCNVFCRSIALNDFCTRDKPTRNQPKQEALEQLTSIITDPQAFALPVFELSHY